MAADEQTPPGEAAPWIVASRTPHAARTFEQRVQVSLSFRLAMDMLLMWHYRPHKGRVCLLCAAPIPGTASWFGHGQRAICEACVKTKPPAIVLAPFFQWRETGASLTPAELEQQAAEQLRRHEAQGKE